MGDSICFHADVIRKFGWGEGLTEDYAFRHEMLLNGIRIHYEHNAKGYGEAALTWAIARTQRARWLRGTSDASSGNRQRLMVESIRKRNLAIFDGALQTYLPSYSSLTLVSFVIWLAHVLISYMSSIPLLVIGIPLSQLWFLILCALFIYPLIGLALERAPVKAYFAILSGPVYIFWRTWLATSSRFQNGPVVWVRTPRREQKI